MYTLIATAKINDVERIVADRYEPGSIVSEVALHHALSPQQLFRWRRLYAERRTQRAVAPPH